MAETDSTEAAMAESASLMVKARDLLATSSHEGLAIVVNHLFMPKASEEHQTARALYDFCVANFANCLTLKLLKVYRCSTDDDVVRFRSIFLLSETLTEFRDSGYELSRDALSDIKRLLVSCLRMQKATESDTRILRIIVSCVASNVVMFDNGGWDELGDCIFSLANSDPLRAFNVFLDLPPIYGGFINRFLHKLREEVYKILLHPEDDKEEDWTLALETAIKLGIQLLDSEVKLDLTREILDIVLKSADELVRNGKEQFLLRALQHLEKFLAKEAILCKWNSDQCGFASEFAFEIAGIGIYTKKTAKKIYQMIRKLDKYVDNPSFRLSPSQVENQESDRDLYNNLKAFSSVEIMEMVAATQMDDRCREIAIRRLHDLLCDHTSMKAELDILEIEKLQKLLTPCLSEVGIPENTFKILGQVVFHVAYEMFRYKDKKWFDLWEYIASECKTHFKKAVYIFQCLTMMLDDKEYVIPAIENLLPEISRRLNPPSELLVDNSSWVLAFTGGFCVSIHLLEITSHAASITEIAYKMIDSVRELVERGMEVGLVRRAFRDLESIVKKQLEWYDVGEYRFVKGLLWRLYDIKGLRMESKIVLWRINVILERGPENVLEE